MKFGHWLRWVVAVFWFLSGFVPMAAAQAPSVASEAGNRQRAQEEFTRLEIQIRNELTRTRANPPSETFLNALLERMRRLKESPHLETNQRSFLADHESLILTLPHEVSRRTPPAAIAFNRCLNTPGVWTTPSDLLVSGKLRSILPAGGRAVSAAEYVDPATNRGYRVSIRRDLLKATNIRNVACARVRIGSADVRVEYSKDEVIRVGECQSPLRGPEANSPNFNVEPLAVGEAETIARRRVESTLVYVISQAQRTDASDYDYRRALNFLSSCYEYLTAQQRTQLNVFARQASRYPCGSNLIGPNGQCQPGITPVSIQRTQH